MADTFVKIASVTVGSGGASSIDFTSIPSTYTDLCIKISARTNYADVMDSIQVKPNNSTSSLTYRLLGGSGSAASSNTVSRIYTNGNTGTASTFGNTEIYFPNYTVSAYKSFSSDTVGENNATLANMSLQANLWSDTAAITSVILAPQFGTSFNQYSTAVLYGIKNS